MYRARFQFLADRSSDFLPDGQIVTEMIFDDIREIVEYVQEFSDAIASTLVYCEKSGRIVDLADFTAQ